MLIIAAKGAHERLEEPFSPLKVLKSRLHRKEAATDIFSCNVTLMHLNLSQSYNKHFNKQKM